MGNIEKKKRKISERIKFLENEMRESLTKKSSETKEIDIESYQRKILELEKELKNL